MRVYFSAILIVVLGVTSAFAAPTITSLSLTAASVGTSVTITGTNFGTTQSTSTVTFNGVTAATSAWTATSVKATIPGLATSGNIVVTVGGIASNGEAFTVVPFIQSLSQVMGPIHEGVVITGTGFGASQVDSTKNKVAVIMGTTAVSAAVVGWAPDGTQITFKVPPGVVVGLNSVQVNMSLNVASGMNKSGTLPFTVTNPLGCN